MPEKKFVWQQDYVEEVRCTEGVLIHIRVGLNSGEVVARSIGNDLHIDYTAVGPVTPSPAKSPCAFISKPD